MSRVMSGLWLSGASAASGPHGWLTDWERTRRSARANNGGNTCFQHGPSCVSVPLALVRESLCWMFGWPSSRTPLDYECLL